MSEDVGRELWWRREGEVWSEGEGEHVRGDQAVPEGGVSFSSFLFYSSYLCLSFSVKVIKLIYPLIEMLSSSCIHMHCVWRKD